MYDTTAGGSYIEAAINFCGVSDEQLINTVARRLKEKLSKEDIMKWPPAVQELENHEEPHIFLRQFLTWLRNPAEKDFSTPCKDAEVAALSPLFFSYITQNRTPFKTQ